MSRVLEQEYLDWYEVGHDSTCRRPNWIVDVREDGDHRPRGGRHDDRDHSCPNETCDHGNYVDVTTIRMLCRDCGVVREFKGELYTRSGRSVSQAGYGQPPTRTGGLWVYPGRPLLNDMTEPWDAYIAETKVDRLREQDIVGMIGQGRGRRGGKHWWAVAVQDSRPEMRQYVRISFKIKSDEFFKTQSAAVKWIATQLSEERERLRLEADAADVTSRSTTSSITP